jgi:hypothetical protein
MESYLALKDVCRVDDAMADKVAASTIEAILDRLLPRTGAPVTTSDKTGVGRMNKMRQRR